MKAALLLGPEKIEIGNVPDPHVGEQEVLIRPSLIGICGSDLSFYAGHRIAPYPFLLGHEVVGHISAVGEGVTKVGIGQRVIVEPNYSCGACAFCRRGRGAICPHKQSMGVTIAGCLAECAIAPAEYVWILPDSISDSDAATIEPLAVSLHAALQSGLLPGDTIAVLGCGATGLLLIHTAVFMGLRVLAYDRIDSKLEMARILGALTPNNENHARLWQEENVSTVFECAGVTATVELAISAAPRGSQVVLVGLSSQPASFLPLRLVREGIRIEGSMIYDHPSDFARAISLVAGGMLRPSRIVTDTFPFNALEAAMQLASTGKSGKIHIEMNQA